MRWCLPTKSPCFLFALKLPSVSFIFFNPKVLPGGTRFGLCGSSKSFVLLPPSQFPALALGYSCHVKICSLNDTPHSHLQIILVFLSNIFHLSPYFLSYGFEKCSILHKTNNNGFHFRVVLGWQIVSRLQ